MKVWPHTCRSDIMLWIQSWYYPRVLWNKDLISDPGCYQNFFSGSGADHSETRSTGLERCSESIWYSSRAAFIQCIHDRPNISQHFFIIYSFICFPQKHSETWSSFFLVVFPLDVFCVGVGSVETWTRFENLWGWLCMLSVQQPCMRCMYVRFFRTLRGPTVRCQGLELYS